MPGETFIEGRRIDLKTVEPEDMPFLRDGVNHPEIAEFVSDAPSNLEAVKTRYQRRTEGDAIQFLIVPRDGEFAGDPVGMTYVKSVGDLRMQATGELWVVPSARRNGFALDAAAQFQQYLFESYGINRLERQVSERNTAAQLFLERLGFTDEGVVREVDIHGGEYLDRTRYAMLAREWPGVEAVYTGEFEQ